MRQWMAFGFSYSVCCFTFFWAETASAVDIYGVDPKKCTINFEYVECNKDENNSEMNNNKENLFKFNQNKSINIDFIEKNRNVRMDCPINLSSITQCAAFESKEKIRPFNVNINDNIISVRGLGKFVLPQYFECYLNNKIQTPRNVIYNKSVVNANHECIANNENGVLIEYFANYNSESRVDPGFKKIRTTIVVNRNATSCLIIDTRSTDERIHQDKAEGYCKIN